MTDFRDENWHLEEIDDHPGVEAELYLVMPSADVFLCELPDDSAARWREIGQLWAASPDLLAGLQALEWITFDRAGALRCPACLNSQEYGHDEQRPCWLAALLAKAKGDSMP